MAAQEIAYEPVDTGQALYIAPPSAQAGSAPGAERFVTTASAFVSEDVVSVARPDPIAEIPKGGASFGPFRVIDGRRAAMVGSTDARSPAQFAALLKAYPGISELELIEVPGTEDDLANLQVGRMIRQYGIATHVPDGGSVRSGGVELFLAGKRRIADPGSEFAVHSWMDEDGKAPSDFAASAPENRRYTDYYQQMGMSPIEAEAFYAMTNSVPFDSARWFGASVMSLWVPLDPATG